MERRHQYVGFAFLLARNIFPPACRRTKRKCLDLIPVDLVCRGMTLIAAALVTRRHERVYHLATSVANPCDMRRSIELTGLGHRKFYRAQNGSQAPPAPEIRRHSGFEGALRQAFAPAQKAIVQAINRSVEPFAFVRPPLARQERELEKVIKLISLFEPFILHNDHVFEAANVERLSAALPPDERADFGYDARSLDWWDYWINVHIPALRKWCYPLIEGSSTGSAPAAQRASGSAHEASAAEAPAHSGGDALTSKHRGHLPDRVHRIYRCPHRVEPARGSFRSAEPAGARARRAGSARASVAFAAAPHGFSAASKSS